MEKTDVIIVLGHRLLPGDQPSEDLKRRIDRAVALWKETGAPIIMPCGGITRDRHRSEAEVMKEMLIARGVPADIIRLEDQSRITLENMTNAYDLIGPDKRVAVVSSDYHMEMAMKDCKAVGLNAYGVGAETPDAAYREEMRSMLSGFGKGLDAMRARGMTNRQIIQACLDRMRPDKLGEDSGFTVGEMLEMQAAMLKKYEDAWEPLHPASGANHLLWMIGEVGEVIDIIKKNGSEAACSDPKLREHLIEEMVDVLMFYNDVLTCYGISEKELKEAYRKKFERNMTRW